MEETGFPASTLKADHVYPQEDLIIENKSLDFSF